MTAYKVAIDAGHAGFGVTAGKRTPNSEYEWDFNNKVVRSLHNFLNAQGFDVLRLDDPTGKNDIPLKTRTGKANNWGADILISVHHNAFRGVWGNHTGTETYTYTNSSKKSKELARIVQDKIVKVYGLYDRGLKEANLHMVRESKMPAILIEGGYMDSTIDIVKLRDDELLSKAGIAIGEGVLEYFGLSKKEIASNNSKKTVKPSPKKVKSSKITKNYLSKGDKGKEVSDMQKKLIALGYDLGRWGDDGDFGDQTDKALRQFQKDHNLVVDGKFGVQSKKALESAKPKSAGANLVVDGILGKQTISALQRYFKTPVDGVISKPKSTVVVALQKWLGIKADGIWGAQTTRALQKRLGTPMDGVISKPSMVIKELQRRLNRGKL